MPPLRGVEPGLNQRRVGILHRLAAEFADDAHQALGQDAIERGDEIVGLDAHIQEPSQHVQHVVGVHRGEHQVSGERGVDGDLGGLLIADFADHDLVRVVAQNGAQPAREGQPLLLIDRNLGDALDLVLHRIFDGDDLVFVVLDLAQRRVESGGLAGAGGSGDQHHAVRLADIAPELGEVGFGKAHHFQR